MNELKFKAIPWKTGNSYVVVIPLDYIKNDLIQTTTEYEFTITKRIRSAGEVEDDPKPV